MFLIIFTYTTQWAAQISVMIFKVGFDIQHDNRLQTAEIDHRRNAANELARNFLSEEEANRRAAANVSVEVSPGVVQWSEGIIEGGWNLTDMCFG